MAERTNSPYYMHGYTYRVKIHDIDYGGAPFAPELQGMTGADSIRDFEDTINCRNVELTFLKQNSEEWLSLIDDLSTFDMGRFYVTIERYKAGSWSFIFKGQIVQDLFTLDDNPNADLKIVATDGLSLLKGFRCTGSLDGTEGYPVGNWRKTKDIFHYFLSHISTVVNMYDDSDVLWTGNSNLEIDDSYFYEDENIWETAWFSNYFVKGPTDEEGSYTSIYEAFEEILNRLFLRISYDDGIYKVTGKELFQEDPQKNTFAYTKTNTLHSSTPPESFPTTLEIGTDPQDDVAAADDGVKTLKSGYREVTILTNDQYNGQWQGAGTVLESKSFDVNTSGNYLVVESTGVTELGDLFPNTEYSLIFTVDVHVPPVLPDIYQYTNDILISAMFLIEVQLASGGGWQKLAIPTTYPIKNFVNPLELGYHEQFTFIGFNVKPYFYQTQVQFLIPENTALRKVRVRMIIENFRYSDTLLPFIGDPPFDFVKLTSTIKLGPSDSEDILNAYYYGRNDTRNMSSKRINLLAGTKYAGPVARLITWNGVIGDPARVHLDKYRFNTGEVFEPIEDAMIRQILKYYGKPTTKMELTVYGYVKTGEIVTFRDEDWYVWSTTIDYMNHTTRLQMLKKNALNLDFDIFLTKPKTKSPAALVNDIYANSSNYSNVVMAKPLLYRFPDTNATELTIPYDIPEATEDSYHLAVRVQANGVFMHVDQELDPSKRQFFQVDWENKKVKFNLTVKGQVYVWIYPQFFDTNVASS